MDILCYNNYTAFVLFYMRLQRHCCRKIDFRRFYHGSKRKVLEVMREAGKPVSAGEVEKLSGLDRKEIDKAFKELKKEEAIVSPVRCKWEPANK